jgi:diguanylate cyclase (GGDEF)-like protein/PAS domain S-box-containing protein
MDKPTYKELQAKIKKLEEEVLATSQVDAIQKEYEIQYRALFDSANDAIILMDHNLIIDCNKRALDLFQCTREQVIGHSTTEFWPESQRNGRSTLQFSVEYIKAALHGEKKSREVTHKRLDGTLVHTDVTLNVFELKGKKYLQAIVRDITEKKAKEEMIAHMAFHDPLTGLPNRRLFDDRLYIALEYARRNNKKLAVMLLDMDKFKEVNDTLGHQVGDKLLKEVATRLSGLMRKSDTLARMGGDEFMFLLSQDINKLEDVVFIANRFVNSFHEPFICNGAELVSSASIGIAICPDHGEDIETLVSHADIAMYQAKKEGGNNFKIF